MRRIKIAQIGTSRYSHGNDIWNTLKKQTDIFEIAGYCFPEGERDKFPEKMSSFDGYRELTLDELLSDGSIEAVAVETEEIYLTKYATLAAEQGKHIHMEKPGSPSLPDFERLIKTVKENGKTFHIGYMYRYNPEVIKLLRAVRTGELGEIISVEAQMNCLHQAAAREWLSGFTGGMMFFLGCHLVDLIMQIQGEPSQIIPLNTRSEAEGIGDIAMAVFRYPNGISFAKASDVEVGGFVRRQLVVSGSKKTLEIKPLEFWHPDGFDKGMYSTVTEYALTDWCYKPKTYDSDYYDRYERMTEAFAEMVRGERENPCTLEYELKLYKTLLKCCGSEE